MPSSNSNLRKLLEADPGSNVTLSADVFKQIYDLADEAGDIAYQLPAQIQDELICTGLFGASFPSAVASGPTFTFTNGLSVWHVRYILNMRHHLCDRTCIICLSLLLC